MRPTRIERPLSAAIWKSLPVLLLGLLLSGYVSSIVKSLTDTDIQRQFTLTVNEAALKLETRLQVHQQLLRGAAALFEVAPALNRQSWRAYAQRMQLDKQLNGIQGIGFSQWIPKVELPRHTAKIQQEGFADYRVRPAGERDAYSSIVYLEPFAELNLRAFGYDMFSEPIRRTAMEQARDQDAAAFTGKVTLVQENGQNIQAGTLMYMPVYRKHAVITTVEERRAALAGWVYSPFRMRDFFQSVLPNLKTSTGIVTHLKVYDGQDIDATQLLYDSVPDEPGDAEATQVWRTQKPFAFNGHLWTLAFELHGIGIGVAQTNYNSVWITFAAGTLVSVLFFMLALSYFNSQRRARKVVDGLSLALRQREDTERSLNNWMRLQSEALQVSANAIIITGVDRCILWANPAFCRLTGYSIAETIGKNPSELLNSSQQSNPFYEQMWQKLKGGQSWQGELVNRHKNGSLYTNEMTITPVQDAQGEITHYIAINQDISERKQLDQLLHHKTQELERSKSAADLANHAKSEFLANMSHEIRTPMNGVIGMVDIMQQTALQPNQARMLDTIQKSALSLLAILNDILDYSKIEAGKLTLESIPIHLREIVEEAAQITSSNPNAKTVALSVQVSPALPTWVMCDPTRLRQVLLNLLGNAVKFTNNSATRAAQVRINVQPCLLAQGQGGVRLSVIDNGIGMSPQVLSKLFQPFSQADASISRKFGGTGLGLSICQGLVKMMGGRMSVRSLLNEGSEFTFELPLQEAAQGRAPTYAVNLTGVHLLILSQDETTRQIVTHYALACGAKASIGLDLTSATSEDHVVVLGPDISAQIADLGLPGGVSVIRLEGLNKLPEQRTAVVEIKINASPLLYDDLVRAIALASGREVTNCLADQAPPANTPPLRVATADQASADGQLILLAEDNEINRDVMQAQLRLLGYASEVAEDGAQALAMWRTGR